MFRLWEQTQKQKIEKMIERGEAQKAFIELTQIIDETTSFDPFLLELRARCAILLSMTNTAIFDISKILYFQKLAQIEKDHLLSVRSAAYLRIGDYENALKDGQKAFYNKKYNFRILNEMIVEANFLINQQNISEDGIQRLLSISPESKVVLYKASKFYLQNKKFNEFDKYSQLFLKHEPSNSEILMSRSKYLICQANDFDESFSILLNCSDGCQELQNNYTQLISFFNSVRDGNYTKIESLIGESNKIVDSICSEQNNNLMKFIKFINMSLLYKQNKLDIAYDIVNELIQENPNDVNAIISKADILFDAGNFEKALETYQRGLSLINSYNLDNSFGVQKKILICEHIVNKQKVLSPFQILDVPDDSDLDAIKNAHKKLSIEWNPDNFNSILYKEMAENKLKKINSAFEKLLLCSENQKQEKYKYGFSKDDLPKNFQTGSYRNIYYYSHFKHPFISHRF